MTETKCDSRKCQGITKKGAPCKNTAIKGTNLCAAHKKAAKQMYVLEVVNDTPYHEGSEFWFDTDLQSLIEWIEACDWLEEREVSVTLKTFGQSESIRIADSLDEVKDIDIKSFHQLQGQLPTDRYYCRNCEIFFPKKLEHCEKCGNICVDTDQ